MNDEQQQLDSVEAALRSLRPAAGGISADQIIYEAGRAAGRRTAHGWQAGSAALALMLAASLLMHAVPGGGGEPRESIAVLDAPPAQPKVVPPPIRPAVISRSVTLAPPPPAASEADPVWRYHALRRRVLEEGLDALQNETVVASTHSPQQADELADVKRLLERPAPPTIREQPLPWWVHLVAGEPS